MVAEPEPGPGGDLDEGVIARPATSPAPGSIVLHRKVTGQGVSLPGPSSELGSLLDLLSYPRMKSRRLIWSMMPSFEDGRVASPYVYGYVRINTLLVALRP